MTEPIAGEWLDVTTRITRDGIYFGDHRVPGLIVQDGITIKPSANDINTITVDFIVGRVEIEDPLTYTRDAA